MRTHENVGATHSSSQPTKRLRQPLADRQQQQTTLKRWSETTRLRLTLTLADRHQTTHLVHHGEEQEQQNPSPNSGVWVW
jgi:hypothetical protein